MHNDNQALPRSSDAPHFEVVLERALARRSLLVGAGAAALIAALGRRGAAHDGPEGFSGTSTEGLSFRELRVPKGPDHAVAPGYRADVLVAWGDPVTHDAPAFDPHAQTAAAQERQFGFGNDFLAYFPLPAGSANSAHGLLFVNHEYTQDELMFAPALRGARGAELTEIELAAHGLTVLEIRLVDGVWRTVPDSPYHRRLPSNRALFEVTGPAAGHPRMRTSLDPTGRTVLGTLNNCAGGRTPWGTALSGEENVQKYFHGEATGAEAPNHRRMGIGRPAFSFHRHQARFRLAEEPNEPNRFGWVVEVDPYDPASTPRKRTALGRFCHEGAETVLNQDGHLVVYMGDDARGEYVYRFVSAAVVHPTDRAANEHLLDHGRLDVARFDEDGTVAWLPLVFGTGPLTEEAGFGSQADVLIETRRAADLLGATPMDRPEDVEASPTTGRVYVALTNNSRRGVEGGPPTDAANPRARNRTGHVLELVPPDKGGRPDHGAPHFRWNVFLLGGDPSRPEHGALYGGAISEEGWLSCPDNLAFDPKGRLWIATDGHEGTSGRADGLWATDTQGPDRARTRRFYAVPQGAELCGPCFTPDGTTLFVAVQHPAEGTTFESPSTRWPDFDPQRPPRPGVVAIRRDDMGPIGG